LIALALFLPSRFFLKQEEFMTKKILIMLMLTSTIAMAQKKKSMAEFTMGPVVGMNSYSIKTSIDHHDQILGSGFSGGAFLRLKVLKVYLQPEFFYHFSSATLTGTEDSIPYYLRLNMQSTQFNGIFGARILGLRNLVYLRAFGGVGFIDNVKKKFELNDFKHPNVNIKDKYYHYIVGAGLDLLSFTADVRYEFALSNITDSNVASIKDRMLILTLGYKIF
jgi:hypothetical protein